MTINSTSLTKVQPLGGPIPEPVFHRSRILSLPRSPKVIAGLVILAFFAEIGRAHV
jgi:hypothetical protein